MNIDPRETRTIGGGSISTSIVASLSASRDAVRAGAHYLGRVGRGLVTGISQLLARISTGLKGLAPVILGVACQTAESTPRHDVVPPPPLSVVATPMDANGPEDAAQPIGQFNITFYYVIGEDEVVPKPVVVPPPPVVVASNDNVDTAGTESLVAITAPELTTLYDKEGCKPIAEVSREFASQLGLQGTGKLRDGRVVNIWGSCSCEHSPCFKVTANQWGTSGTNHPLQPFRTVAVDRKVVKLGTLLHVPLLEGRLMPGRAPWGGFIHDGCVVADDTGGGIDGNQLDLFVGRKAYFLGISGREGSHAWARDVAVFDGTGICERKGRRVGRKAASI